MKVSESDDLKTVYTKYRHADDIDYLPVATISPMSLPSSLVHACEYEYKLGEKLSYVDASIDSLTREAVAVFLKNILEVIFPSIGKISIDIRYSKINLSKDGFDTISISCMNSFKSLNDVAVLVSLLAADIRSVWE